jgi:hypothetical protein
MDRLLVFTKKRICRLCHLEVEDEYNLHTNVKLHLKKRGKYSNLLGPFPKLP